jgi:hypothetical protein
MAINPLTPDQQAALERFEADAQAAESAHESKTEADDALLVAKGTAERATETDLADHQKALESAKAFVDLMIPPPTPPTPVVSSRPKP